MGPEQKNINHLLQIIWFVIMKRFLIAFILILQALVLLAGNTVSVSELSKLPDDTLINRSQRLMQIDGKELDAIAHINALINKSKASDNKQKIETAIKACNVGSQILFSKELYVEAFKFMVQGVKLSQDYGYDKYLPELYKNIGNVYSVYDENDLAIQNYEKSLDYCAKLNDKATELKTLCNLSGICVAAGNNEKAQIYYNRMITLGNGNPIVTYFGYLSGAMIANSEANMPLMEDGYKRAIDYATKEKFDPKYVAAAYSELANAFRKAGMIDSARYYFEKNRKFCHDNNLVYEQRANLKALIDIYSKEGRTDLAGSTREQYYILQDSMLAIDDYTKIKDNEILSEMEKNYAQISSLSRETEMKEAQIQRQRTIMAVIFVFLLFFAVASIVVYRQKQNLYQAHRHLYLRNAELMVKEKELDSLMTKYSAMRQAVVADVVPEPRVETAPIISSTVQESEEESGTPENGCTQMSEDMAEAVMESVAKVMSSPEIFCSNDFNLDRLAQLAGYNSRYVSQAINNLYGKNFRTFVNEYRINEASKRLMDNENYGHLTIRAIGEDLGFKSYRFKSYSNFIDTFKKIIGMAPSMYRKIAIRESQTVATC